MAAALGPPTKSVHPDGVFLDLRSSDLQARPFSLIFEKRRQLNKIPRTCSDQITARIDRQTTAVFEAEC